MVKLMVGYDVELRCRVKLRCYVELGCGRTPSPSKLGHRPIVYHVTSNCDCDRLLASRARGPPPLAYKLASLSS
jgi:hypothetical protein